jgi:hypothetical protein
MNGHKHLMPGNPSLLMQISGNRSHWSTSLKEAEALPVIGEQTAYRKEAILNRTVALGLESRERRSVGNSEQLLLAGKVKPYSGILGKRATSLGSQSLDSL